MSLKVLHLSTCDKFLPSYIRFLQDNLDFSNQEFLLTHGMAVNDLQHHENIYLAKNSFVSLSKYYFIAIYKMIFAKKIIFHGLFDFRLVCILFFMPWLLKKSYWIIWGGDLYTYKVGKKNLRWRIKEFFRRPVIKRFRYLINVIKGDLELCKKWYLAEGEFLESITYPSNLSPLGITKFVSNSSFSIKDSMINILVGNSGSIQNNHYEIFKKIEKYKDHKISIFTPLTYGDANYIQEVIYIGKKIFGEDFYPILAHMTHEEYMNLLNGIDIAVFNHPRQQALGNIISLLGLGKKVFIRSDITSWNFFHSKEIEVFDIKNFEINPIEKNVVNNNQRLVESYFSKKRYLEQLEVILG